MKSSSSPPEWRSRAGKKSCKIPVQTDLQRDIKVATKEGEGTTFIIQLPVA